MKYILFASISTLEEDLNHTIQLLHDNLQDLEF